MTEQNNLLLEFELATLFVIYVVVINVIFCDVASFTRPREPKTISLH